MNKNLLLQQSPILELTQEQKLFFDENGYLHIPAFINEVKVAELLSALDELGTYLIDNQIKTVYGVPLRFGKDLDGRTMIQRYAFANKYHQSFQRFLQDPNFNVVTDLLGPGSRLGIDEKDGLVINHYVNCEESKFSRLGWHTDSLRELLLSGKVTPMLNVGIHLDDYPMSLGGLRVLPGTHKQSLMRLLFRKSYFRDNDPDPDEVGFDIKAGDLTVHDGRVWHRVAKSAEKGERSRRRVLYIPVIQGKYAPKFENSRTAFYHRLGRFARFS